MKVLQREIDIAYKQIAVFREIEENPFPFWTDSHVRQGFAWRPEAAAFATLRDGIHAVEIAASETESPIESDVIRAIEVPFDVTKGEGGSAPLEVASIADGASFNLESGSYTLRFELGGSPQEHFIRFTFITRKDEPHFALQRVDAELDPDEDLVTTAEPA
jgi:Competence protein J (ComJ)